MRIANIKIIREFQSKHADSRTPLNAWIDTVRYATWRNHTDIKETFSSADYISKQGYCFNVGGNNIRLLAQIFFGTELVSITWIKTHSDYDKWKEQ